MADGQFQTQATTIPAVALQMATIVSVGIALFVGLLYAAGGLAIAGELEASGYGVQDAFPLTTIPQVLARGLAVLLDPLVLLSTFPFLIYFWRRGTQCPGQSRQAARRSYKKTAESLCCSASRSGATSATHPDTTTRSCLDERLRHLRRRARNQTEGKAVEALITDIYTTAKVVRKEAKKAGVKSSWVKMLGHRIRWWGAIRFLATRRGQSLPTSLRSRFSPSST